MKVPDELVEVALGELDHAMKHGPVQDAFYVRQALEAVLRKARERLLADLPVAQAEHALPVKARETLISYEQIKHSLEAAFDHAFPEEES